jgi:hypothetical protein
MRCRKLRALVSLGAFGGGAAASVLPLPSAVAELGSKRSLRFLRTKTMKALSAFVAAMTLGAFLLLAADSKNQQADRELLGRLHSTFVPDLRLKEVPVERAIARYLELLAAEWRSPKPLSYRVERRMRQLREPLVPVEPGETVNFAFSQRPFADALRELIAICGWSFTVRDGVIIFRDTLDLYREGICQQPIILPK